MQAVHEQLQGESDIRQIAVGGLFTLSGHPRADQNREYLIIETTHELHADNYGSGSPTEGGEIYRCEFSCIDGKESFRSRRTTPKPIVQGPQTAVITGRSGEEIYTDEYSRVKVQFHWDRYGESNENSSCWVRVAQPWAGKNWGAISIPRIGQEVVVEFLEGDPDRPLITGSVYNADQMPPWGLPLNQTQSGILSRSTKGGTQANANAIRFEDKKGEEQLWLHAEKDQLTEVENDETKWVGNDRKKTIDGNETTTVHKNRTETVDQNETITIKGNQVETFMQNKAETILIAKALSILAGYQVSVGASKNETVGLSSTEEVGMLKYILAGKRFELQVGKSSLILNADGTILMQGEKIAINGARHVEVNGELIDLN